jgi:hypothetical protein
LSKFKGSRVSELEGATGRLGEFVIEDFVMVIVISGFKSLRATPFQSLRISEFQGSRFRIQSSRGRWGDEKSTEKMRRWGEFVIAFIWGIT